MRGTSTPDPGRPRLAGMDGFRGLGAPVVVLAHVWLNLGWLVPIGFLGTFLRHGQVFLVMFFVLSGFLLYRPYVEAALDGRTPSARRYLRNRVLRVWPAYVVVLGLSGLVLGVATTAPFTVEHGLPPQPPETGWLWTSPVLLAQNLLFLQTFLPGSMMTGLGPAWTLSVEVVFYLLLPVIGAVVLGLLVRRLRLPVLLAASVPALGLLGLGLVGKWLHLHVLAGLTPTEAFFADWGPTWQAVLARSFLVHCDLIGCGMAVAVLYVRWQGSPATRGRLAVVFGLMGLGAGVFLFVPQVIDTGAAIFWMGMVLLVATRERGGLLGVPTAVFDSRLMTWLGERSYSLYLWHMPVILLLVKLDLAAPMTHLGLAVNAAVVMAVSLVLAHLTWELVEKPALSRKKSARPATVRS